MPLNQSASLPRFWQLDKAVYSPDLAVLLDAIRIEDRPGKFGVRECQGYHFPRGATAAERIKRGKTAVMFGWLLVKGCFAAV